MRILKLFVALLALAITCYPSHRRRQPHSGTAGVFDFYLFVLSWSPEFCHSRPDAAECGAHAGFVVHGLWPQNKDGTYPSRCQTNQPGPTNPSSMSDVMPQEIVQHEWEQHGTCSGLSGDAYFALIRRVAASVKIPGELKTPGASLTTRPHDLKQQFERANRDLNDAEIAIQTRGNYLNAVEFCVSKSQNPVPLACSNVPDTTRGTFVVPPVR